MKGLVCFGVGIGVLLAASMCNARPVKTINDTSNSSDHSVHPKVEFEVATVDFKRIEWPFMIMVWILVASFAKLGKRLNILLFVVQLISQVE